MSNLSRREWHGLVLGGLTSSLLPRGGFAAGKIDSTIKGVRLGAQSYSFRDRPLEGVIEGMKAVGLGEIELWSNHVEPRVDWQKLDEAARKKARDEARAFRLETPLARFHEIGDKFKAAGIDLYAYNYSFGNDFTDEEISRGFEHARALGAEIITASTNLTVARRVVPFAEKHQMAVAVHNHSNTKDPNEFATPESFAAAMALSKYFKVNLDIGHFTAANYDPIAYLREHHADITNLHLKDRKRDQGDNTPWGTGDTKIREVLALLKREKWPIRAYIEYEYRGAAGAVEEVGKCLEYAKQALA